MVLLGHVVSESFLNSCLGIQCNSSAFGHCVFVSFLVETNCNQYTSTTSITPKGLSSMKSPSSFFTTMLGTKGTFFISLCKTSSSRLEFIQENGCPSQWDLSFSEPIPGANTPEVILQPLTVIKMGNHSSAAMFVVVSCISRSMKDSTGEITVSSTSAFVSWRGAATNFAEGVYTQAWHAAVAEGCRTMKRPCWRQHSWYLK